MLFPGSREKPVLAELAQNPVILDILIDMFRVGPFPQNPGILMQRVTRKLWEKHPQDE
jgi:hypothetical protein